MPTDIDPARLFRERVKEAQWPADLDELVKHFGANGTVHNEEQLRRILQANPQLQQLLNSPEGRDLLDKTIHSGKLPTGLSPEMIQRKLADLQQDQPSIPRLAARPPIDAAAQARKRELANQVEQWAERLPESVRNSPALKDQFQRLSETAAEVLRNPSGPDGFDAIDRMETRLESIRDWLPKEMPAALQHLRMPDLSRFAPNVRLPHLELTAPEMPPVPHWNGSAVDARSAANGLIAAIAAVIIVAVVWRLFGGRLTRIAGGPRALGPWPLDPARVASRVELIQAFEYLSLLRCGEPARSWHHRAIAECLGGAESDRQDAAARLAELYEQARYAPATVSEPDWSAARGPLSLLAEAR